MEFALPAVLVTFAFGIIGFLDDFIKIRNRHNQGLRAYQKLFAQILIALLVAIWAYRSPLLGPTLYLPISGGEWNIGVWYIPLVVFTIVAEVNAVNLTDGLDGLASSVTLIYMLFMVAILTVMTTRANQNGEVLQGTILLQRGDLRRRRRGRLFGVFKVQHVSGQGLYGRYRFASRLAAR